jgi:hypothetical protein
LTKLNGPPQNKRSVEELTPEQKEAAKDQVDQAVKLAAVHVGLRWTMVVPYAPEIYLPGMLLSRAPARPLAATCGYEIAT